MLDKIIKDSPKAWAEFENSFDELKLTFSKNITTGFAEYNFRNLYDYFDGLGIYVTVWFERSKQDWHYNVENKKEPLFMCGLGLNTRTEAEWSAFYEAFKIRESQLS